MSGFDGAANARVHRKNKGENLMGMVKHYLMEYCEATHPGDDDAQDKLFEDICSGEVQVSLEEMKAVVDRYREQQKNSEQ